MKKLFLFLIFSSILRMSSFGQETGLLTGTLRDQLTKDPLFGVKVTAGGQVTRTDEAGGYSLTLLPGVFDVRFNRYGLYPLDIPDLLIIPGDTLIIDTTMSPFPVPVSTVSATSMDNSTWLQITWSTADPAIYEKATDNGEPYGNFELQESGSQVAVKFQNEGDHIIGGRIFTGDSTNSCPFFGSELLARVYDDEGTLGLPGNILDEDTVTVDQYGWFGFDGLNAQIQSASYYLAIYQLNDTPYCTPIAYSHYPTDSVSIMKYKDYNWEPFTYGNAMIRPWLTASHDSLRVYEYELARVSINGSGDTSYTMLLHTGNLYYNDYTWFAQSDGCYLYAVRANYNNGQSSNYTISNYVCHYDSYDVSIIMDQTGDSTYGLTDIKFIGQAPPFMEYSEIRECPGTAEFNTITRGKYQVQIFKPGHEKLILDSIDIHSDTTFEITLQQLCYPAENLHVNPFTALLTWDANSISQFSWKCDTPDACHSITTPQLDLTTTEHWTLMLAYNYNSTVEPASVDYSTDHGRTWAEFYALSPQPGWDTVNIDLSPFSGENGESEIMFQIHDYQGQPYYLDLGEARVRTSDIQPPPQNCLISLNGESAGSTDTTFCRLISLVNGNAYHAGVYAVNCAGQADTVFTDFIYRQLFPPENLISYDKNDSLFFSWSPPSGSWGGNKYLHDYPDALTGYILHFESKNISTYFEINDPLDTSFSLRKPTCDTSYVSVTAVYNLSDYGYPGERFESLPDGPMMLNSPGPIMEEFFEDWSSMSFYVNCWSLEGNGMSIVSNVGNPGPAFVFQNTDEPYQAFLTSYPLFTSQTSDGNLILEFDLTLISNAYSGHETLEFQVNSEGTDSWISVKGISNFYGDIDWTHFSVNLGNFVEGPLFRLRLKFSGYGGEMAWWAIDNIQIHNVCQGPGNIYAEKINEDHVRLNWKMSKPKIEARNFEKFRISRDVNDTEYMLLAETVDTSYIDTLGSGGKYCYRVTAFYNEQGVICESPLSDSACITSFLDVQDYSQNNRVRCYPNPAMDYIIINSEEEIQSVTLYNSMGKMIKAIDYPELSYKLVLNGVSPGIYLLRFDLFDAVFLEKILIISN